ncbi:MAG: hypothetical protein RJQ07_03135 [Pseudomonadales bacterium]
MFGKEVTPITSGSEWFIDKPLLEKSVLDQNVLFTILSVLAIATVVYAVRMCRREATAIPLYILVGAALACFYEPLGDLLAHVTYAELNQVNYIESFGFLVPLWVLPAYILFFGLPTLYFLDKVRRGMSLSWWMSLFVLSVVGSWLFEIPLIMLEFQSYYGDNAPFKLLGYPVWMGFVNAATMSIVATCVVFLRNSWLGREYPSAYVILFPLLVSGANTGSGLPLSYAINSSDDVTIVNLMACVAIILSTAYAWICGNLLRVHGPLPVHYDTGGVDPK